MEDTRLPLVLPPYGAGTRTFCVAHHKRKKKRERKRKKEKRKESANLTQRQSCPKNMESIAEKWKWTEAGTFRFACAGTVGRGVCAS
jgi:hypothetical protein